MAIINKYIRIIREEVTDITKFCNNNKILIFFTSFIIFLSYGFEITNFTLSIDEELASVYGSQPSAWIQQGRFGVTLIKLITRGIHIIPFWNTLLSVCILLVATIVFGKMFHHAIDYDGKNDIGLIIFGVLFVSFPVHIEYLSFNTYNLEVSIGLVICAVSVSFISKWCIHHLDRFYLVVGTMLLVFAISIYQSFVLLYIAGVCTYCCLYYINSAQKQEHLTTRETFFILGKYITILVVSLIFHKGINTILQIFYPSSGYIEGFFSWGTNDFRHIIKTILGYIYSLINGSRIYGGKVILPTILVGIILVALYILKGRKQRFIIPILISTLMISPFILTIFLGAPTPLRSLQVLPFVIGTIWYILYYSFDIMILRKILVIVIALVVIYQSQAITALSYSDNNRYQQDIAFGNQISNRIESLGIGEVPVQPVVYVGTHSVKANCNLVKSEVMGYSFFEWDGGNNYRIGAFMQTIGHSYIRPTQDQIASAKEMVATMPAWPDKESVSLKNGIIIVKLSEAF